MKLRTVAAQAVLLLIIGYAGYAEPAASGPIPQSPILLPEPSGQPGQIELTLDGSVRKAILDGTTVLKAQYETNTSGAQLLQAYGQFLPNLTGAASYGYSTGLTYSTQANPAYVVGSGTNASYAVTTDLNIFNGLADYANLKSAVLKKTASELTLFRAKQQIKLDVVQSYFQVVLDHRLVDIAVSSLRVSLERERLFAAQVKVGLRHLADLFRQQAQTSVQELQLLSARNKMLTDQLALLKKLRLDVVKGYRFIEPVLLEERDIPVLPTEQSLLEAALQRRVDLRATHGLADATRWDAQGAWSGYLPKLDLVAGVSSAAHYLDSLNVNGAGAVPVIQNNIGYQLGDQLQYTVGVNVTWTLFDRFLTHQTISRLQAVANSAQLDSQDQKNKVEADVRQAYGDYITVIEQLRSTAKGLVAAQKAYDVLAGRYTVGGVNLLDLLTGQDILSQAQATRAQALIAFQLQSEALRFATGEMTVD